MKMHKEALRKYLHNRPLVQAIEAKSEIDATRMSLLEALEVLNDTGIPVSEGTVEAVKVKAEELHRISLGYSHLLGDVFEVGWQREAVIKKYLDFEDEDIAKLPEYVSW